MSLPNPARAAARLSGSKFFEGDPCDICEATRRYVSNGTCVACAIAAGQLRYSKLSPEQLAEQKQRDKARYEARLDSGVEK